MSCIYSCELAYGSLGFCLGLIVGALLIAFLKPKLNQEKNRR